MTMRDDELKPEEFAQAAVAPIDDAKSRTLREAARVLAEAGLIGVCACEDDGGLGLDIDFAVPIVHAAGKQQLRFPLLEQIALAKAFAGTELASALASGERLATIAVQGSIAQDIAAHARYANECDWLLVADGAGAALVDVSSAACETDHGLDPECPQEWLSPGGARVVAQLGADAYAVLQRDLQVLVAAFVNGAADGALETAATYMSTRVQFGRPLSAKQAVRHLLARMKLVQEASAAAIRRALATDEYETARDVCPVLAGTLANAAFVIEKAIHLHGGMGFTWEVPLHYSLREVLKFDAAFGAGGLAREVGRDFIAAL
ncbi:Acyl-CoA dehydrogenase, C-terminal domain protein [Paraburkholderia ribeironis]|uniref:Acyl-CoA dehydrogenase, C-terminal domain protein n=1 Tax=Paraburkholderia ribeironis TaxID=1247936 RepID=A0A1N7RT79_9BURK|nr:acyl-CoA dehydrogenase family protein [Paraburkholderia ribeironis]SIT38307.1 Acyl-CoA dehydrogenase, C-terminal domain protein [Paraburkholderia ribeironis]